LCAARAWSKAERRLRAGPAQCQPVAKMMIHSALLLPNLEIGLAEVTLLNTVPP
jgi:hypothetical protein